MRRRFWQLFFLPLVILLFVSTATGRNVERRQVLAELSLSILEEWHYCPRTIDDRFSQDVFRLYINSLDPDKRFFTESDIKKLQAYELAIGRELKDGNNRLLALSSWLLAQRIKEVQSLAGEILAQPFDFFAQENFETDAEKRVYVSDSVALRELWRKILKYRTLLVYLDLLTAAEEEASPESLDREKEKQAREKVGKSLQVTLERILQDSKEEVFSRYLNAVSNSFDPHTSYFTPERKENFDIEMRGTLEGIGALLQEEGEYIKVVELVPGGAAWRQGELKPGDIIIKVAQGEEEAVDLYNMNVNKAVGLIRGKKGTEVRLTVRKPEGHIVTIAIIRDLVVLEETYARPAVLTQEEFAGKFGYIYLPSFYRDFQSTAGRSSAGDMKNILQKMNKEKIDGLILDLRNNGGGSLEDALKMAGFFIKSGPLLQIKGRHQADIIMNPESDPVYDGPMVVLVNTFTASGAEILAAVLQDYGRAVIAGDRTFGKGSIQSVIDLDRFLPQELRHLKPLGSLKLTIQQFYRVTGEPIQYKGVTPDVFLPDQYGYINIGERTLEHALPGEALEPVPYKKWEARRQNDPDKLRERSRHRVEEQKSFQQVAAYVERIKQRQQDTRQSLNLAEVLVEQERRRQEAEELQELQFTGPILKVYDLPEYSGMPEEKFQEWCGQIRKDMIVGEAVYLLRDLQACLL